jgi:hypothetical protein
MNYSNTDNRTLLTDRVWNRIAELRRTFSTEAKKAKRTKAKRRRIVRIAPISVP